MWPDQRLGDIVADMRAAKPGHNPPIKATKMSKSIRLNFAGKATRFQGKSSVYLTSAFGQHFFVEPGTVGAVESDGFVPAWLIPSVNGSKAKDVAKDDSPAKGRRKAKATAKAREEEKATMLVDVTNGRVV